MKIPYLSSIQRVTLWTSIALISLQFASSQASAQSPVPAAVEAAPETAPKLTLKEQMEDWRVTPTLDVRTRYEYANQGGRRPAHSGTVRTRAGLLTKEIEGFQAFIEYEGTLAADRNSYQAASVHGLGRNRSIIADPESHELNQLWGSYTYQDLLKIKAGRQGFILDNQRYVGTVAWRQNMQTFDSATLTLTPFEDFTFFYGYIWQVNRIFGSGSPTVAGQTDFEGNSHLFQASYSGLPFGTLTAYAYLFDLHNLAGDANSNQSYGIHLTGKTGDKLVLAYLLEYALQTDAFDSPLNYTAHYFHGNLKGSLDIWSLGVGYEWLGSDNGVGYNFPLGTNHAFNGFADVFLATPGTGLQDIYISAGVKLPMGFQFSTWYHKFYSSNGNINYGDGFDAVLTKDLGKGFSFLAKLGYYDANKFAVNTTRFTAEINYKF